MSGKCYSHHSNIAIVMKAVPMLMLLLPFPILTVCQDWFSTDLSSGIWRSGFGLVLRPECCIVGIMLPRGWEGQLSA